MIVSASRRTDIPSFYTEWLIRRLNEGYVLVRNPVNSRFVSRISLLPDAAEFIVFWTKNPAPMISGLDRIDRFSIPYYFLFTVTPYDTRLERNLPDKDHILETFRMLSERIGKRRTIWRYDPVVLSDDIDETYHRIRFERICAKLENRTGRCIISFLDLYRKCRRNLQGLGIREPGIEEKIDLARDLVKIAAKYGIVVQSCAEDAELSAAGVKNGKCIDDGLISEIIGKTVSACKDRTQRKRCGCVESVDIGAYDTCTNGCLYCYANSNPASARRNRAAHDPASGLIFGEISPADRIVEREMRIAVAQ
jgi:hypothetical protein